MVERTGAKVNRWQCQSKAALFGFLLALPFYYQAAILNHDQTVTSKDRSWVIAQEEVFQK